MTTPRRAARELALLSAAQVLSQPHTLSEQDCRSLMLAAIRTLALEVRESLELASSDLNESHGLLLKSELAAPEYKKAQSYLQKAIETTESTINRLGTALELPEILYFAHQDEVQMYALALLNCLNTHQATLDQTLGESLVDWQVDRLANIDRTILQLAIAEMMYLDVARKVAINEAVELAKRYSDEGGHRFINGVLRRFSDRQIQESNTSKAT
ncbi:transcription antitermination factor NusB [Candidatus Synechococcus calcipolaris G9]|uniref:Transcription antitermination protein NusB n=1 Tax=Candidatus Synechococcus calcipolaris G9 TaxID=1497997 RepID=A0ABT6EZ68_9SYNE|nr:transcription antitermination factor NusB [Candidatus Synechococcus calcipolaris]MDG2990860.1 transcription antitermination factor NusB [Candidatus Synechococcus calcipolaris G9]